MNNKISTLTSLYYTAKTGVANANVRQVFAGLSPLHPPPLQKADAICQFKKQGLGSGVGGYRRSTQNRRNRSNGIYEHCGDPRVSGTQGKTGSNELAEVGRRVNQQQLLAACKSVAHRCITKCNLCFVRLNATAPRYAGRIYIVNLPPTAILSKKRKMQLTFQRFRV